MSNYQLPSDGSVVIVDDKIEEALPLIRLLSQRGVASTYYSGTNDNDLPQRPLQKVRLAFFDIQLFPNSDSHTYAQNILTKLDRIIPDDNGPYLLIIWSVLEDVHAATLRSEVTAKNFSKRPAGVLTLRKSSYFNIETDDSTRGALLEAVESSLRSRFSDDDLRVIKKAISDSYQSNPSRVPVRDAFKKISKELKKILDERDILRLFAIWENCINKMSGKIINSFSSLHDPDDFWQDNLRSTMYRMAHAQLGKKIDSVDDCEIIKNAIKTLNYIFLGMIEGIDFQSEEFLKAAKINKNTVSYLRNENGKKYEIRWLAKSGEYQLYVDGKVYPSGESPKKKDKIDLLSNRGVDDAEKQCIKGMVDNYLSILPDMNTKLFIDFNVSSDDCPGVVYKKSVRNKRKRRLLGNYFKAESKIFKQDQSQNYIVDEKSLNNFLFIELNIIPFCDHAQEKWIKDKIRLLPGVMLPEEYLKELRSGDSFYKAMPLLKIAGVSYSFIFDFRLLKSEDVSKNLHKRRKPWFKVKNDVLSDILSRLSSHASRVGVSFVE